MPVLRCAQCGHRFLPGNQLDDDCDSSEAADEVSAAIAAALLRISILSPRETEIFQLLGAGRDNRNIARHLGISERTVKRHVTAILAKIGVTSRLQAGLVAFIGGHGPKVAGTKVP